MPVHVHMKVWWVMTTMSARDFNRDVIAAKRRGRRSGGHHGSRRACLCLAVDRGAATAAAHGLTVVTRNVAGFENAGVPVINPWI